MERSKYAIATVAFLAGSALAFGAVPASYAAKPKVLDYKVTSLTGDMTYTWKISAGHGTETHGDSTVNVTGLVGTGRLTVGGGGALNVAHLIVERTNSPTLVFPSPLKAPACPPETTTVDEPGNVSLVQRGATVQVTWNLPFPKPVGCFTFYDVVPASFFEELEKSGELSSDEPFSKFNIAKGKTSHLVIGVQIAPGGVSVPINGGADTAPVDCNVVFHLSATLERT